MTCLWIGVKFDSCKTLSLKNIFCICKEIYTADEVKTMEFRILKSVEWKLNQFVTS